MGCEPERHKQDRHKTRQRSLIFPVFPIPLYEGNREVVFVKATEDQTPAPLVRQGVFHLRLATTPGEWTDIGAAVRTMMAARTLPRVFT